MARLAFVFSFFLVAWVFVGCSTNPNTASLAQVSGKVTLDNKPMAGGDIRFSVAGQPVKVLEVKDGAFSGQVFTGKNRVEVAWDVDGSANPMDPSLKVKVNKVAAKYTGVNSPLATEVPSEGKTDLKFEVTSK